MASLLPFPATGIRTYASSDHRKSNPHRSSKPSFASSDHRKSNPHRSSKPSSASTFANPNRCAPIFGWSSEPNYINGNDRSRARISDPDSGRAGSRFTPGCFTEEKAKELRKKTMESVNFHDIMYHLAIASQLRSDLPDKPSRRRRKSDSAPKKGGCLWAALVLELGFVGLGLYFGRPDFINLWICLSP